MTLNLKTLLLQFENRARWLLGGFIVLTIVMVYVMVPLGKALGMLGEGDRPHIADWYYVSAGDREVTFESAFDSPVDCDNAQKAMAAAKAFDVVTECKRGEDIDAAKAKQ